jgi:hypothetical protein
MDAHQLTMAAADLQAVDSVVEIVRPNELGGKICAHQLKGSRANFKLFGCASVFLSSA